MVSGPQAAPRRMERAGRRDHEPGGPSVLALAWAQLWKRTAGGSFERLPDPARHPECWFRIT